MKLKRGKNQESLYEKRIKLSYEILLYAQVEQFKKKGFFE